ncbi:histidine kinase [Sporichthya sp.]|uniref:sensor histidine kinase n=1 Tax=Sporichthya sp. TaxID=65475 RepID=UPI001815CFA0|nr:histidine kinase [Sporichthya sp.]MBA3744694.1 sensor histidine kinase [Sporichthya sp.]
MKATGDLRALRPPIADVAAAVLLVGFTLIGTHEATRQQQDDVLRELDLLGYFLAGIAAAILSARRITPVGTLAVSGLAVSAYLAAGYAYGPILLALGFATLSAAALLPMARSLPAIAVMAAVVTTGAAIRVARDPDAPGAQGMLAGIAWLVLPWSIGTVLRMRTEGRIRTRHEEAARAADAERLRIAAEVHDIAGHGLAMIAMQAGVALHVLERKPEQARIALEEIRAASTEALDGLRATLDSLRTRGAEAPLTPGLPGVADVPPLVERIRRAGLSVELQLTGDPAAVPATVGHAAYRVAQESLTNVLRHSEATHSVVHVNANDGEVTVSVLDNGTVTPGPEGSGIAGMRARVEALGGTLSARPRETGGFGVEAVFEANRLWPQSDRAQGEA